MNRQRVMLKYHKQVFTAYRLKTRWFMSLYEWFDREAYCYNKWMPNWREIDE